MLCRTKHEAFSLFSNLFRIFSLSLHSKFPFLSSPTRSFTSVNVSTTKPKSSTRKPNSLITRIPQISPSVSSSDANSIFCLLSDQTLQFKDFDNLLEPYKPKLDSNLVLQILMNYRQLGRVKTLEFFSWAGAQIGFQFDDCVIEYMADFLGRRKLFDDMKCLLLTVLLHRGRISCRAFSICIRFLGRQGRVREALCLFQEMDIRFSCKPDNFVYNNMLYVLCNKGKLEEFVDVALTIFRKIESPDTYSYSNILVGSCKFGRFEIALEVFDKMVRTNLVPTRSAVNLLIGELCNLSTKEGAIQKVRVNASRRPVTILVPNLCSKAGAIQPAVGVFWAVFHLGLLPSSFVVIRLISELCRLVKMKEAYEILMVVEERKLNCVEEGYSVLIQALCEHRLLEEANHLFDRILSLGLKPKLVVYNSIICMLCKLGRVDDAKRVFEIMSKKRCLPDTVTYTALVHAYGEARNWEVAYELLKDMLGIGLIPHFHTYNLVDRVLKENGMVDLANKLEMKLETQILHKQCKEGRLDAALEKLKAMLEKGLYPPFRVRDAFENAFRKHGKMDIAREWLQKMDEFASLHRQR